MRMAVRWSLQLSSGMSCIQLPSAREGERAREERGDREGNEGERRKERGGGRDHHLHRRVGCLISTLIKNEPSYLRLRVWGTLIFLLRFKYDLLCFCSKSVVIFNGIF